MAAEDTAAVEVAVPTAAGVGVSTEVALTAVAPTEGADIPLAVTAVAEEQVRTQAAVLLQACAQVRHRRTIPPRPEPGPLRAAVLAKAEHRGVPRRDGTRLPAAAITQVPRALAPMKAVLREAQQEPALRELMKPPFATGSFTPSQAPTLRLGQCWPRTRDSGRVHSSATQPWDTATGTAAGAGVGMADTGDIPHGVGVAGDAAAGA